MYTIKRLIKAPCRMIGYLLMLTLSVVLLTIGWNLYAFNMQSIRQLNNAFHTIGMAEQLPDRIETLSKWNRYFAEWLPAQEKHFEAFIPISVLQQLNVEYIVPPEKRPFYFACIPEAVTIDSASTTTQRFAPVVEFTVKEHQPFSPAVTGEVTRRPFGKTNDTINFCTHAVPDASPLQDGLQYVACVQTVTPGKINGVLQGHATETEYLPYPLVGTGISADGRTQTKIFSNGWEELSEGFYETEVGQVYREQEKFLDIYQHSVTVQPITSLDVLLPVQEGELTVIRGRSFEESEVKNGERVCLLPYTLAMNNGWQLGDKVPLQLYLANYDEPIGTYRYHIEENEYGMALRYDGLNLDGKCYPVFESAEYTVVGLYRYLPQFKLNTLYDLGLETIFIPSTCIQNDDTENRMAVGPMNPATTSFQIPNDAVGQFMEQLEQLGLPNLQVTFHDGGYRYIRQGIDQQLKVAAVLIVIGLVVTLGVIFLLVYMDIHQTCRDAAIALSLGGGKRRGAAILLSGILLISLLGAGAGAVGGYLMSGKVSALLDEMESEPFDDTFSENQLTKTEWEADFESRPLLSAIIGLGTVLTASALGSGYAFMILRRQPMSLLAQGRRQ